jgi:hypothetical protein
MRPIVYPVTATDVANGFTVPLPVDYNRVNGQYGIQYLAAGGGAGAGTLQSTLDNPFTPPSGGLTWATVPIANGRASINQAVLAFRVSAPTAGDVITIVAQGASAAG